MWVSDVQHLCVNSTTQNSAMFLNFNQDWPCPLHVPLRESVDIYRERMWLSLAIPCANVYSGFMVMAIVGVIKPKQTALISL